MRSSASYYLGLAPNISPAGPNNRAVDFATLDDAMLCAGFDKQVAWPIALSPLYTDETKHDLAHSRAWIICLAGPASRQFIMESTGVDGVSVGETCHVAELRYN